MPRKAPSSSRTTATKSLALSSKPIHLEALEKEHQWLLKQIKRKRTELNNFVEQMRSIATDMFARGTPSFNKLAELDQEIHNIFNEILTTRNFSKKNKKNIEEVYRTLQFAGIISVKFNNSEEDTELDELFEADESNDSPPPHENQQHQQQELPAVTKNEQSRKIRSSFLRLAEIFHPDKVTDKETQERHTEIMKEINLAYQEGDLARLLEIEQQHQQEESISIDSQDDLTRLCTRLEQENELLKTQYKTLKKELTKVKKTPEGEIVADCRKAVKEGIDPVAEMLKQVESQILAISEIRNFVKDFLKQKITIKEFLHGPAIWRQRSQDITEEFLEMMFDDDDF